MKLPVLSSLLLMLGASSPLFGIERPSSLDENAPKEKASNRAVEVGEPAEMPKEKAGQQAVAWLGVFGESADEALTTQLGVESGVVLRYVAEDSPAAEAGLQVHDLLTTIDGEAIASQDDLRESVMEHRPGDEVKVEVVSRGVKAEKVVKLGERPANLMRLPVDPRLDAFPGDRLPELRKRLLELDNMFPRNGELQRQMEEQMKRLEENLKDLEGMPDIQPKIDELLKNLPKQGKENFKLDFRSMGAVELHDDEGSVKMKMRDGGTEVEVRNKAGDLLYKGPWDNEQDKAAVDPAIKERIEKLNFKNNGMNFQFNQGGGLDLEFKMENKAGEDAGEEVEEEEVPAQPAPEEKDANDELD